jgi:hypothetical protein
VINFDAGRARCSTIIGAAALTEVDDAYEPERPQSRVIEATTTLDVGDAHRHMIQLRMSLLAGG